MTERNQNSTISFVSGLIAGFIISAPVAAWLSPRSGPERREMITQRGVIVRRKVADSLRKPVEQVQEQLEQLKGISVEDALAEGKAIASRYVPQRSGQDHDTDPV